jgi:hypothetical protein
MKRSFPMLRIQQERIPAKKKEISQGLTNRPPRAITTKRSDRRAAGSGGGHTKSNRSNSHFGNFRLVRLSVSYLFRSKKRSTDGMFDGVADGTRTHDDQNHNLGLYQLSYSHRRAFDSSVKNRPFEGSRSKRRDLIAGGLSPVPSDPTLARHQPAASGPFGVAPSSILIEPSGRSCVPMSMPLAIACSRRASTTSSRPGASENSGACLSANSWNA